MGYKRSARRESTHFIESRINYWEDNLILGFLVFSSFEIYYAKTLDLEVVEQY
jgi:hypothetical protein